MRRKTIEDKSEYASFDLFFRSGSRGASEHLRAEQGFLQLRASPTRVFILGDRNIKQNCVPKSSTRQVNICFPLFVGQRPPPIGSHESGRREALFMLVKGGCLVAYYTGKWNYWVFCFSILGVLFSIISKRQPDEEAADSMQRSYLLAATATQ